MAKTEFISDAHAALVEASANASRTFFTDPESYTSMLSRTKDGLFIIGCIEPRPLSPLDAPHDKTEVPKNIIQTPGGGFGPATDAAVEMTASTGSLVTVEEGFIDERDRRTWTMLDAHDDCRFLGAIASVTAKSANPDELTLERARRWNAVHELDLSKKRERKLMDANKELHEYLLANGHQREFLDFANQAYPKHKNVKGVAGPNISRVYVVNHHPAVVLNRIKKFHLLDPVIQGYHDGIGATMNTLRYNGLTPEQRLMRAGNLVLRSSATMTLIGSNPGMTQVEIFPARNGLEIIEQEAA